MCPTLLKHLGGIERLCNLAAAINPSGLFLIWQTIATLIWGGGWSGAGVEEKEINTYKTADMCRALCYII